MKKLLLATILLLSIAMSENIFMENRSRPKRVWIRDKQFKKPRQALQGDGLSEMEQLLNYDDDDRQFPRLSDTRFVSESMKLPSLAFIRPDADKPKLNIGKPSVLISIGIQEGMKASCHLQENCSTKKNYSNKHSQAWKLQQPFYVDEPRWIEIDSDYVDGSSHVNGGDPYILSRGKKIFRIKDPEEMSKLVKDYELLDYLSKAKRPSMKSRVRRSVKVDKPDEKDRDNVHQAERAHSEDRAALEVNKRNKRSIAPEKLAEVRRKYEAHRLDWTDASLHTEIKKNATFSGTLSKAEVNQDVYDNAFVLSRGKKNEASAIENHADHEESVEKPDSWKLQLYMDRNESTDGYNDKPEIFQDNAADSRLIRRLPAKVRQRAFAVRDHQNREKRDACEDAICNESSQPNQWLRNIERELQDSLLLVRRDKHRDSLLESLRLNEPYVISRGKKASSGQNHRTYPTSGTSRVANADDHATMLNPIARILLRMLLMAGSGPCNSDNCDVNALEPMPDRRELAPRDRRGTLDEILARYDPYYVARGKRAGPEEVLKLRIPSLWKQRDALLGEEDDAAVRMNDGLQ